jgi:hypothetical protein
MRAVGQQRLGLTAHRKDLEGKSAVVGREHRDAKLFKALAHALLRGSPIHADIAPRQRQIAMRKYRHS